MAYGSYTSGQTPGMQGPGGFPGQYGQYQNTTQNPNGSLDANPTGLIGNQAQALAQQSKYQYGTNEFGNGGPSQAAKDAQYGVNLTEGNKMSRFNQVFGLLGGQLGKLGQGGVFSAGGANTAPPPMTAGPVLNDQQIQQQVNRSQAATDQGAQSQMARTDASVAGRGFGSNSPLAMALNGATEANARASNAGNETNLRLNAAQQNAGHLLNSQQALSNQWATGNQLDIQRRAPVIQQQTALLQALAGLV